MKALPLPSLAKERRERQRSSFTRTDRGAGKAQSSATPGHRSALFPLFFCAWHAKTLRETNKRKKRTGEERRREDGGVREAAVVVAIPSLRHAIACRRRRRRRPAIGVYYAFVAEYILPSASTPLFAGKKKK